MDRAQEKGDVALPATVFLMRRSLWLTGAGIVGAVLGGLFASALPELYEYAALIRVGQLPATASTKAAASNNNETNKLLTAFSTGLAGSVDREAKAYLDFKYVNREHALTSPGPYVRAVYLQSASEYILVEVRAAEPTQAEAFAKAVLKDLQDVFAPRLADVVRDLKSELAMLEKQQTALQELYDRNVKAMSRVGYSPILERRQGELLPAIALIQQRATAIQAELSPVKARNFSFAFARPTSSEPVSPKLGLYCGAGAVAAAGLAFFVLLVMEALSAAGTGRKTEGAEGEEEGAEPEMGKRHLRLVADRSDEASKKIA